MERMAEWPATSCRWARAVLAQQSFTRTRSSAKYVDATGDVSSGPGGGAKVLVDGSHRTITLQPLSIGGQVGVKLGTTGRDQFDEIGKYVMIPHNLTPLRDDIAHTTWSVNVLSSWIQPDWILQPSPSVKPAREEFGMHDVTQKNRNSPAGGLPRRL